VLIDCVDFGRSGSARGLEEDREGTEVSEGIGRSRRRGMLGREGEEIVSELGLGGERVARI